MAINHEDGAAKDNLEDDTVKLIAYTIVSLKRDKERIMEGGQASVILTDSMTGEAFTGSILAKYLQQEVPDPKHSHKKVPRSAILDPDELKYLRVYYVVSKRWPREPLEFEERQV